MAKTLCSKHPYKTVKKSQADFRLDFSDWPVENPPRQSLPKILIYNGAFYAAKIREKYLILMPNYSKTLRIRDLSVEISNCDHEDRTPLRYGGFIMLTAFINFVTRKQEYSGVTNKLRFQVLGGFK